MFDKDFDQSLWCILECDKEKRNEIIEFLKRIPNELLENLSELLATINHEEAMEQCYCYEKEVISDDGFIYSYSLDFEEQEKYLTLKQELATPEDNASYMNFGVELDLVKEYPPYTPEIGEEFHIGNFCDVVRVSPDIDTSKLFKKQFFMPFIDFKNGEVKNKGKELEIEIEYSLVQNPLGYSVRRMHCNERKIDDIPVDINEFPLELTIDYIDKRYNGSSKKKNMHNK